jgi:predicted nucleic acid-binding protein
MFWARPIETVAGGAIYDALLAGCALKAKAEILYTWNVRHFQRFTTLLRVETP